MIIFDLDNALADCEHRRHFVDPSKNPYAMKDIYSLHADGRWWDVAHYEKYHTAIEWKPDWPAFYEACEDDTLILPTWLLAESLFCKNRQYSIWSGRCESVRAKTEKWLDSYDIQFCDLKMRPIGDTTPDHVLKERWLDEVVAEGKTIDFVFDDRPKVVRMWQRRGIFVFNCAQSDKEF